MRDIGAGNGLLELVSILGVLEIMIVAKIAHYAFPHRHLTHAIVICKEHSPPTHLPLVWLLPFIVQVPASTPFHLHLSPWCMFSEPTLSQFLQQHCCYLFNIPVSL